MISEHSEEEKCGKNFNKNDFKLQIVWKNVAIFAFLHYCAVKVFCNWHWSHFWFRKLNFDLQKFNK
jgi:hypothetical protein